MPYETVDEIFELCKRAWFETNSYVSIDVRSFGQKDIYVSVYIQDKGYSSFKPFDGAYGFSCNEDEDCVCRDDYKKDYENCKMHLERLIKGGMVGV